MFSRSVAHVSKTKIFARATPQKTQMLVYSMTLAADAALAMVLPVPTSPGAPDDALRFIDLEDYPTFFDHMRSAFPPDLQMPSRAVGLASGAAPPMLTVHEVGAFEASFVPTLADFARLDPRFALPPATWEAMPGYADWGFAVFKLKGFGAARAVVEASEPPRRRPGFLARLFGAGAGDATAPATTTTTTNKTIHPMAFELRPRDPGVIFFPTVHVHDGTVHETAHFDHTLYCQIPRELASRLTEWDTSFDVSKRFMDESKLHGCVDPDALLYRRTLVGERPNRDQWLVCA